MNVRTVFASAALGASLLMFHSSAQAQEVSELPADLLGRLEAQESRIRDLESQLQRSSATTVLPASSAINNDVMRRISALETATRELADDDKSGSDWTDVSAEKWTHKWGGRIQGDSVMFADQDGANRAALGNLQNYFEFRRLRLFVEGDGYGVYDYKLQFDFEPENGTAEAVSVRDAYVGIHELPYLGYVRFGNYKEPFSLEELTSSKYITFLERSLPTTLWAPARHVGATSYVSTPEDDFTFAFGIFYEDISQTLKERVDDNQGVDLATRFTWSPIYANEGRHVVHVGGGAVYTEDRDEQLRFSTRPEVHEGTAFVDTGTFDADYYFRFNSEAAVVWGPASIQTEGFYVTTNGINGFADMDFYGAYVYASYFLTGENRVYHRGSGAFGRVAPITNFWAVPTCDGTDVGSGAWEAALRWSYVDLNDNGLVAGSRGELHDLTAGLNWYWNPNTRMMFNWIHAFNDRVDVGDNDADILSVRMQVDF